MNTYEAVMMMLALLTFIIALLSLIVKLLLIIIDKELKAKKQLPLLW